MFDWLVDPILNTVCWFLSTIVWSLFALVFILLKYIAYGIEVIATALPKLLLFGSTEGFSLNKLPYMFGVFALISIALWFIFFLVIYCKYIFISPEDQINSIKTAAKYSVLCWVYMFLIPVGVFGLYFVIDWIVSLLGANNLEGGIGEQLFRALRPSWANENTWENIIKDEFFLSYDNFVSLGGWRQMGSIVLCAIFGFFIGAGVMLGYFYAGFTIMIKIFDNVFLFCLSPVVATSSVLDGGKRIATWRDMIVSKALIIFGIIIGSRMYASILSFAVDNIQNITNNNDVWLNQIVIGLIAIGGAYAFAEFGNILTSFVGEGASLKESMAQTRGLIASTKTIGRITKIPFSGAIKGAKKFNTSRKTRHSFKNALNMKSSSIDSDGPMKPDIEPYISISTPTQQKTYAQMQHHKMYSQFNKNQKRDSKIYKERIKEIHSNQKMSSAEKLKEIERINKEFEEQKFQNTVQFNKQVDEIYKSNKTEKIMEQYEKDLKEHEIKKQIKEQQEFNDIIAKMKNKNKGDKK